MAFIVEDGSGVPFANSFASVEFFQDYVAARGYADAMTWSTPLIQVCLVRATDFFQAKYSLSVSGFPVNPDQSLCFPRNQCRKLQGADGNGLSAPFGSITLFIRSTEVPLEAQKAVCELAISANIGNLYPDIDFQDFNTVLDKIGPITTEYSRSSRLGHNVFRAAAMLMQPFVASGGSSIRMNRS